MQTSAPPPAQPPSSTACSTAALYSLLSWDQLSAFWQRSTPAAGWYLYALAKSVRANRRRGTCRRLYPRDRHPAAPRTHEDYCGIVYADDLDNPSPDQDLRPSHLGTVLRFQQASHPARLGDVENAAFDLSPSHLVPQNRKRWWQGFLDLIGAN